MRECNLCRRLLPASEFASKSAKCRACKSNLDAGRERSNPRSAQRNDTDAARARKRKWARDNRDITKERAYRALRTAIEQGLILPRPCETCGSAPQRRDGARATQAHHYRGYDHPLDVKWLCPPCHRAEHDAARAGEGE